MSIECLLELRAAITQHCLQASASACASDFQHVLNVITVVLASHVGF